MLLKIAFRNILRQKRRSLLTAMTMLGGFVLAAVSIAWGDGTYSEVIRLFTHNRLGDIQVHADDFLDNPTINKTIRGYPDIGEIISRLPHVDQWAPRVLAGGLASVDTKTTAVRIIGIDVKRETAATHFERKITTGPGFSAGGRQEAIIGKGVARLLNARVGDKVVIVSQAADGSIANDLYSIAGITASGDDISDRTDFYLRLQDAQDLFALPRDQVHEIAVTVDNNRNVAATAALIRNGLDNPRLSVEAWQEFAQDFYRAMKADLEGMWIMLFIIVLIVAVGVLNTVLMAVLERRREYGVLRALGTRPAHLCRLVLYEAALLAIASIAVGAGIALVVNYSLSIHGVVLPEPYSYGGMMFDRFRTEINLRSFLIPAGTILVTAVFVSLFPALKAARTDPARSMRMH
jgi:putative ABC transport system permease protein